MSKIKISKPERLPRDNISDVDFLTWRNELINYLGQDDNFEIFYTNGFYSTWTAAENDEKRISQPQGEDTAADLSKRRRQLHNFLTITAGCCHKDHYMTILQQSTSFEWIWQEIRNIYQITHRGKDFLNIVDIKWDPTTMSATTVYNAYRAKIIENLKPAGTKVTWKNTTLTSNEALSPTFEDHILISVLQLIDARLPSKVREIYGPRMENVKFLMDFKQDILSNVQTMIDSFSEQDNDVPVNAVLNTRSTFRRQQFPVRKQRNRKFMPSAASSNLLFCRLCHTSRQARDIVTSHEIGDLSCPSLSERDKKALQNKGIQTASVIPSEEDELDLLAQLHGYDDVSTPLHDPDDQVQSCNVLPTISYISPVPSQILTLYQNDRIVHVDLDSGSWVSCVLLSFAQTMNWKISPNAQLAKLADNTTVMRSVGEIHQTLSRNNWTVELHALVLTKLHTNVIGGNNFLEDNKIEQSVSNKTITIHGKYVVPETNRNIALPTHTNTMLVSHKINSVILPQQSINVPVSLPETTIVKVEPRIENKIKTWPEPQLCAVTNGQIEILNSNKQPISTGTRPHLLQLRTTELCDIDSKTRGSINVSQNCTQTLQSTGNIKDISINTNILTTTQLQKLHNIHNTHINVFNKDLSNGYNHQSGKHYCKLNWATATRPSSKKVICPSYNRDLNVLLQEVCDDLTKQNVLGIPQEDNIIVQCVSPCFLRRKQKAKDKPNSSLTKNDVRLVVNTNFVGQHLKNIPSKITKPQEIYAALSRWKYLIKTDMFQGFFQNHLHPTAFQWCAIQTPFGGIRYFKRSIQGLLGQSEEEDELLAKILHEELKDGICIKIADDIFAGGQTINEAITNYERILKALDKNNIKLSPAKTVLFPSQVDVLSWVWKQGGYLSPSPHRRQALSLVTTDQLKTIKDLRSWLGLYKTFIDCTPHLTSILDPFDAITGNKQSNDPITWTPLLSQQFHSAQEHIKTMKDLYLPTPDDQLIITCDGARTPPAVGMVLQAKTPDGQIKIVKFYSVKLKKHTIKWFPCEIEAAALGTAVEAFYEYIKNSKLPVLICPDSKAVVDAAIKIAKGHFSLSPRIQTFLNNLGKIRYHIQHVSGKSGQNSAGDFQSRSAAQCSSELCQICNYVNNTAETVIDVKLCNLNTESNDANMPFLNRSAWKVIQARDKACQQAIVCITSGQTPSKKSGKINVEIRRFVDKSTVAKDGLLIVKSDSSISNGIKERIVIPTGYLDSLLTQIHLKFQHPSKHQLTSLFNKYFFSVATSNAIESLYDHCQFCKAAQILPKALVDYQVHTKATQPGTHFGIDIVRRAKQKIMVAKDQFSSFITAKIINSESASDLLKALTDITQATRHPGLITIRVDSAPGFKSIAINHKKDLNDLNINLELGDQLNKNSNACVDKGIAELNHEIKKITLDESPINELTLHKAITNINHKLRRNGQLSAADILFSRDRLLNTNISLNDKDLSQQQYNTRITNNKADGKQNTTVRPGNTVVLKQNPLKHHIRDTFLVTGKSKNSLQLQKLTNLYNNKRSGIKNITYNVPSDRVITCNSYKKSSYTLDHQLPTTTSKTKCQPKSPSVWDPIPKHSSESDDDTEDETNDTVTHTSNVEPTPYTPPVRKPIKEKWSIRRTSSRLRNKKRNDKHDMQPEQLRHDTSIQDRVITPLSMEQQHTSEDSSSLDIHEQPHYQLDVDHLLQLHGTINEAFLDSPDVYPTNVVHNRVYDFSSLPPLPPEVTSPPQPTSYPVTSTPKSKAYAKNKPKTVNVKKKLSKLFKSN